MHSVVFVDHGAPYVRSQIQTSSSFNSSNRDSHDPKLLRKIMSAEILNNAMNAWGRENIEILTKRERAELQYRGGTSEEKEERVQCDCGEDGAERGNATQRETKAKEFGERNSKVTETKYPANGYAARKQSRR
jgi:hypothetical protein